MDKRELMHSSVGVSGLARMFGYASPASGYDVAAYIPNDFRDYYSEAPRWGMANIARYLSKHPEFIGERPEPPFVSESHDIMQLVDFHAIVPELPADRRMRIEGAIEYALAGIDPVRAAVIKSAIADLWDYTLTLEGMAGL